jgi:NAD(P)-dependent dehydrogenase (short-subunit alcohol dehydrogenase family)
LHLEDFAAFQRSIETNLNGPFYLTRYIMPDMVQKHYGRCVYTSSTAAIDPEPCGVGYNTSKAGLCGLMRSVCQDGGQYGITANAVLPGWVKTEMADESARVEAAERGITFDDVWKVGCVLRDKR